MLTDEQQQLREVAAKLAAERYAPRAQEWDRERQSLPDDERARLAELGLVGITLPEEYGGGVRPLLDALLVIEELAKASMAAAWPVFEGTTGPARVVELFGTDEQKQRILPPVARGGTTIAVAISEADAGSAATDAAIKARVDGEEIVIDGAKRWCSGVPSAPGLGALQRGGAQAAGEAT